MKDENLVVVYVSQGPLGAEVAKAKLQAHDIPATLRYQSYGRILGLTIDGLGRVEVMVLRAHEHEAREVLSEIDAGEISLPESEADES